MQTHTYEDVTALFAQATQDLKPDQMLHSDHFSLHDSMSAIEIYDPKMDLKANLKDVLSLEQALESKTIKPPSELTIQEVVGLLDGLLGKEILWLSGQSLPHTIYTFSYLYDPQVYDNHKFLKSYIEALYAGGALCQELVRHSPYLREEDYIPSTLGFPVSKNHEELLKNLVDAEYELEDSLSQKKKKKKKQQEEQKATLNEFDALHARLRLRRALLTLYVSLKGRFTVKLRDQISINISSCLKILETVRESLDQSADCDQYFFKTIHKTLLSQIPPRDIKAITKADTFAQLESMLQSLQAVLQLSTLRDLYDIQKALQSFSLVSKNVLVRAYLGINIFHNNSYFGLISVKELALAALEEFNLAKGKAVASNEKVIKFVESSSGLLEDILVNNLKIRSKQRRDVCKVYQNLNLFAHDAYTLDEVLYAKGDQKVHVLFLWVLDIALKMMIGQFFLGFEIGLYSDEEYSIIFYLIEQVFFFLDRNFMAVISKYDKDFIRTWDDRANVERSVIEKKRKKLTEFQRKFFAESYYYKAIQNYVSVMLKLSYLVVHKQIIKVPEDKEVLKNRYYLRLRVFDNVYFLKKHEFEDFVNYLSSVDKADFDGLLKSLKEDLDSNIKLIKDVVTDENMDPRMKTELEKLQRVCVLNSLAIMPLQMNKNDLSVLKATFKNNEHPLYPVLVVQKK